MLQAAWLWFRSRCARVSGITWGSLGLLAGTAAPLKQVPNGYKIRFGQFIVTTWIHALVNPLPFILEAVSSYLSNWCYWWRGTDLPPFTPSTSLPPPPQGPAQPAIRPHVSGSIHASSLLLCTSAHWTLLNPWRWWASDRWDPADRLNPERPKWAMALNFRPCSDWK